LQAFLRSIANEEAFARNINDLRDEGTGKLVELTIRYQGYEWSFSCGENDLLGHTSSHEDSRQPHFHFQMRVNRQAFIRFNNFHVQLSHADIALLEAMRIAPNLVKPTFSGGPGMEELLKKETLEKLVMSGVSIPDKEAEAPIRLSSIMMAKPGTTISGDKLADLIQEAKEKRVTVTSLLPKLQSVSIQTIVTPGPGVVEQTPRSGRGNAKKMH
jgi:hypothetical protein